MKKFIMSVVCATLLFSENLHAITLGMNEACSVLEVQDEKKGGKNNDKENVVLVIELDAHTEIIETRMISPSIGAGLTDTGHLKVWSDVQVQAQVEITDADGLTLAGDFFSIAPGSPSLLSLAGLSGGMYQIHVILASGAAYTGIFML